MLPDTTSLLSSDTTEDTNAILTRVENTPRATMNASMSVIQTGLSILGMKQPTEHLMTGSHTMTENTLVMSEISTATLQNMLATIILGVPQGQKRHPTHLIVHHRNITTATLILFAVLLHRRYRVLADQVEMTVICHQDQRILTPQEATDLVRTQTSIGTSTTDNTFRDPMNIVVKGTNITRQYPCIDVPSRIIKTPDHSQSKNMQPTQIVLRMVDIDLSETILFMKIDLLSRFHIEVLNPTTLADEASMNLGTQYYHQHDIYCQILQT
jgi:hypothetical protein